MENIDSLDEKIVKKAIVDSLKKIDVAERSFDLRTSGLWAQHASTAPLCYLTTKC